MESRHGPSTGASSYSPPAPTEVWAPASPRDGRNGPVRPTHQPVLESGLLLLLRVLTLASLSLALSAALLIPQHPRLGHSGPRQPSSIRRRTRQVSRDLTAGRLPAGRSERWASPCADPASSAHIRASPSHSACPASGAQLDNCCVSAVTRASQRPSSESVSATAVWPKHAGVVEASRRC